MEPFVDFGLFELLAAVGLSAVARRIYSRRVAGILFLALSAALPITALFWIPTEQGRWIGAAALVTALVNASVAAAAFQHGHVPVLELGKSAKPWSVRNGRPED